LEQCAQEEDVLIDEQTLRLLEGAVRVEPLGALELKGRKEPVEVYRLRSVVRGPTERARRQSSPLVGRERDRVLLFETYQRAVEEEACHLFTVLGDAGVGKSRLVNEFLATIRNEATVAEGRCLSYGHGITFWPAREAVKNALGLHQDEPVGSAAAKIEAVVADDSDAELITQRVLQLSGLREPAAAREDVFWGVRKFFEWLARRTPLVVVFDDIHWAEPTFLDLVDYLADWSRDVPMLLLCMARPELLDRRPFWSGGKLHAVSVLLDPLKHDECDALITNLLAGESLERGARVRIAEATGHNPLFIEELVAMLVDEGVIRPVNGSWMAVTDAADLPVPPTSQALLAARVDALRPPERLLIERAAVIGKLFHLGALAELLPSSVLGELDDVISALMRKDILCADRSSFLGDEAFRFRHLLLRDAAYGSLAKDERAELHERCSDWFDRKPGEYEQIVGYHLEQAARYGEELGELSAVLAERAAKRLGSAGQTALNRGDFRAGRTFLRRAIDVLPEGHPRRFDLLPPYIFALLASGARQDAPPALDDLRTSDDPTARAYAEVFGAEFAFLDAEEGSVGLMEEAAVAARPFFAKAGDELGLAYSERTRGLAFWVRCRASEALEAFEQAQAHAEIAGQWNLADDCVTAIAIALSEGSTPRKEASVRCLELLESTGGRVLAEAAVSVALVSLRAIGGEVEEARQLLRLANATTSETAYPILALFSAFATSRIEQAANDVVAEERAFREGLMELERLGDQSYQATLESFLAEFLVRHSRDQEAEDVLHSARKRSSPGDVVNVAVLDGVEALLLARRGEHEKAERLARAALALAETTDFYPTRGASGERLAAVLVLAGNADDARDEFLRTVGIYERKGAVVSAARVRGQFAALAGTASR
jgi:AAA ATPase domain